MKKCSRESKGEGHAQSGLPENKINNYNYSHLHCPKKYSLLTSLISRVSGEKQNCLPKFKSLVLHSQQEWV